MFSLSPCLNWGSIITRTKCVRQICCRTFTAKIQNKSKHQKKDERDHWMGVVGLEIHAQIGSASKLFSGAGTEFSAPVNTNVSLFDAAIPGTLPVLNRRCIEAGVLTALALSCTVNPVSLFDRKHYFYADLPAGYQITQQRLPLAHSGELQFLVSIPGDQKRPYVKVARIKQLQLEQDSGRSLHDEEAGRTLVDLNRAGIPLMELVFEPDLENGEEAASLVKELILILQCLETCSCKMEEGALRVDANVSVHREHEPLGVRTEVKNIGSVRGVAHAIEFEIKRQIKTLEDGGAVINETRCWNDEYGETIPMRDKEEKQDYRYMPEPNLPPLRLVDSEFSTETHDRNLLNVKEIKKKLPELPRETREKLISQYGLSLETAVILVNENILLDHFNFIMKEKKSRDPKLTAKILLNELLTICNKNKLSLDSSLLHSQYLGEVVDLLQCQEINLASAKKILEEILTGNPQSPTKLMDIHGLHQIKDPAEIESLCEKTIEQNPKLVKQFLTGKTKVFNSLVGKIAKETNNRANMGAVVEVLTNKLESLKSNESKTT